MVSWRLRPPPELVPRELGSLGVALDWVLLMYNLFPDTYIKLCSCVVAALAKLYPSPHRQHHAAEQVCSDQLA
ncbi:hypothetical protein Tco_0794694 [Tanacetum coccineum]